MGLGQKAQVARVRGCTNVEIYLFFFFLGWVGLSRFGLIITIINYLYLSVITGEQELIN